MYPLICQEGMLKGGRNEKDERLSLVAVDDSVVVALECSMLVSENNGPYNWRHGTHVPGYRAGEPAPVWDGLPDFHGLIKIPLSRIPDSEKDRICAELRRSGLPAPYHI